jgi:hypothetical protein
MEGLSDTARSLLQAHRRATSDRLKEDLALNALRRAIALRHPLPIKMVHLSRSAVEAFVSLGTTATAVRLGYARP